MEKRKYLVVLVAVLMIFSTMPLLSFANTLDENDGIRFGHGYWNKWLAESDEDVFSGHTNMELLAILETPAKGNVDVILSYQYISAALNVEVNKCEMPIDVHSAFIASNDYLHNESGATRKEILGWKDTLEIWNEGGGSSTEPVLAIGDTYGGGIVAYVLQQGDSGYIEGEQHGLIASIEDQSIGISWAKEPYWTVEVTGTLLSIGSGADNTDKIIAQNGAGTDYAAGLARAYGGGGFTDWYLPSLEELEKLYDNREAIGGFGNFVYWSSSEYSPSNAWKLYFWEGVPDFNDKSYADDNGINGFHIRAVRSF